MLCRRLEYSSRQPSDMQPGRLLAVFLLALAAGDATSFLLTAPTQKPSTLRMAAKECPEIPMERPRPGRELAVVGLG